jgi:hypothetical protein
MEVQEAWAGCSEPPLNRLISQRNHRAPKHISVIFFRARVHTRGVALAGRMH